MLLPFRQSSSLQKSWDRKEISQQIISIKKTQTSKPYNYIIHPGFLLVANLLMHQASCPSDVEQYKSHCEK